jgi:hypothetical protein
MMQLNWPTTPSSSHFVDHHISAYMLQFDTYYEDERLQLKGSVESMFPGEKYQPQLDDFMTYSSQERGVFSALFDDTSCTPSVASNALKDGQSRIHLKRTDYILRNRDVADQRRRELVNVLSAADKGAFIAAYGNTCRRHSERLETFADQLPTHTSYAVVYPFQTACATERDNLLVLLASSKLQAERAQEYCHNDIRYTYD